MKQTKAPAYKHLVLLGGGHSHVSVIKSFGMNPIPGVEVTVVCRDVHTPYSGMLPGLIAGHYTFDEAHIDLDKLCAFSQVNFVHDEVVALDPAERVLKFADRPDLAYDVLSINTGSSPDLHSVPGAQEFAVPVKPINSFLDHWAKLEQRLDETRNPLTVAVVGAGAGGIELLLSVQNRIENSLSDKNKDPSLVSYRLLVSGDALLSTHNRGVRKRFESTLRERNVQIDYNARVSEVHQNGLELEQGSFIEASEILWVTSAAAPDWPAQAGLDVDLKGFIKAEDSLQTLSYPNIFVAGDVSSVVNHPREKAGVFAVRQGPPLAQNIRAFLLGDTPNTFKPQEVFLGLISTGDKFAVASWGPFSFSGKWVWKWKDKIDRKFMALYSDFEPMDVEEPHIASAVLGENKKIDVMRCSGCAAKVGGNVLSKVMARVRTDYPHLIPPVGADDAAIIEIPGAGNLVQSVDFFRSFIRDPYLFGQIAANHCLNDLFAMGVKPHSALAIVALEPASNGRQEETLYAQLAGALDVFRPLTVQLAGGHTAEYSEPGLGFTVNGFVEPDALMRKTGLHVSDELILTKPLGTGVIMAGQMRLMTKGRWIEAAVDGMLKSNHAASLIFQQSGVTACTDVTGFGLVGHILEMTQGNSELSVEININELPELDGVTELLKEDIVSSLSAANGLAMDQMDTSKCRVTDRLPILFDPQTAGGLLAAVSHDRAQDVVSQLHKAGYDKACSIGTVVARGASDKTIYVI